MKRRNFARILVLLLVFSMLFCGSTAWAEGGSPSDAKSAVVRVYAEFDLGEGRISVETGTAFGVGKDDAPEYFVTNAHVCMDDYGNMADRICILLDNDALKIGSDEAGNTIVDLDEEHVIDCEVVNDELKQYPDVAVLKSAEPVADRTCLPLVKSSADVEDGSTVYALGYPGDMDVLTMTDDHYTVVADAGEVTLTSGIVSKKTNSDLVGNTDVVVHSATISSGNSGGPLIDEDGAVVGINTYGINADSQYLSIYIDYAIDILEENDIAYESADHSDLIKTIILIAIILIVAAVAIVLVLKFRKSAADWTENSIRDANALRVQGVSGYFNGRRFPLEGQVSFGRDPSNSIVFPTGTAGVSANHCVVINNNGQLYIKDLGSSYGTAINGSVRLSPNQLTSLQVGDRFSLGSENEAFIITRKGGKV